MPNPDTNEKPVTEYPGNSATRSKLIKYILYLESELSMVKMHNWSLERAILINSRVPDAK